MVEHLADISLQRQAHPTRRRKGWQAGAPFGSPPEGYANSNPI